MKRSVLLESGKKVKRKIGSNEDSRNLIKQIDESHSKRKSIRHELSRNRS